MDGLFSLTNRIALVTGASSGLGRHFAHTLASAGATVAVAARRERELTDVVSEITAAGGNALAIHLDVRDAQSVEKAFEQVEAQLGVVNVLVNNAGVVSTGPALELAEDDWDRVMDTNLKGAWTVARSAARRMVANAQPGAIVNIASILGIRQAGAAAPYAISKAGIVQMTKVLALELARQNIRVNAIAPGYIETDLNRDFLQGDAGAALIKRIPQRRAGKPEDLDGALLLLASDASSFMTGTILTVDGGHLVNTL
ncbi:MAG: 2-deoxy-D-gluconate 3-dehydrogenase [Gammaproteobacteria bacterium]|nr:MAG: 2-deoxy-D-gluconate 3-dehydrogenase [Gammaproteobacteria bacterium]